MSGRRFDDLSAWAGELEAGTLRWLGTVSVAGQAGRYRVCERGLTPAGEALTLGPSCFALKILWTLGAWPELSETTRQGWVDLICSFQAEPGGGGSADGSFLDPVFLAESPTGASRRRGWKARLRSVLKKPEPTWEQRVRLAETKQALASLSQVGARPRWSYRGLPAEAGDLRRMIRGYDWTQPWAAGGQTSGLATLLALQEESIDSEAFAALRQVCVEEIQRVADPESGGYFRGGEPPPHQLVNGAMKVLTALDWLGLPIHFPQRLIDRCLAMTPRGEGCDVVDVVYVLWRCLREVDHRRPDVQRYVQQLLPTIAEHWHEGGGFSYYPGRSQTTYYRLEISAGQPVADIHGSCLLLWASAMSLDLLGAKPAHWEIIRP